MFENRRELYGVKYHEYWLCRYCYEEMAFNVLVPEEEGTICTYKNSEVFHFGKCPKCGERTDRLLLTEEEFIKVLTEDRTVRTIKS